jgi:hypothetical protein
MRRTLACLVLCLLTAGCVSTPPPLPPTLSIEIAQTSIHLTQNAPPPGFERGVQFPRVDDNLARLSSWHYRVSLSFDGVYSGTKEPAKGLISAEIYSNEIGGERRVLLKASGAAFGSTDRNVEGVRISNDYYLVDQNKTCAKVNESPSDRAVADLSAGSLVGGVKKATPVGEHKMVNEIDVWEYAFLPDDVVAPSIELAQGGKPEIVAGDLWVAPSRNAVFEYTITLKVDNAIIQGGRQLTGQVRAAYQLIETGVQYNIAIPYGC